MAELRECELDGLRPTQITVGMIEVADKRKHLAAMGHHERKAFLQAHAIPAVFGPDAQLYLTDHHHLARALCDGGYGTGFFMLEADLSKHDLADFWKVMAERQWVHPVDASGQRCPIADLPLRVEDLLDDPYRSLAGYVREAGGYGKTPTAFEEFQWAAFFRSRIKLDAHPDRSAFDAAVTQALALTHTPAAKRCRGTSPEPAGCCCVAGRRNALRLLRPTTECLRVLRKPMRGRSTMCGGQVFAATPIGRIGPAA